jgi:selenide,water dikinase
MLNAQAPIVRDIVLVGCGHAHVAVLRGFGMHRMPGVRLTLVTRETHTPYSGMLPGHIAGHYSFDDMHIDAGPLCRFAGARLIAAEAHGVDFAARQVHLKGRPPVAFDILSLDIGSVPNTASVRGAAEHALPVKPIDRFLPRFEALRARVLEREGRSRIVVVGGGAGGVELLLSVRHRLRADFAVAERSGGDLVFRLVTASEELLPGFNARTREYFRELFAYRGVAVDAGRAVEEARADRLILAGGDEIEADEILWVTEAVPAPWLGETGIDLDERGFVRVDRTLRSTSHPFVFAAGDVASVNGARLPKSGVWAVRQGRPLADNLRAAARDSALTPYRPQKRALALVSTGDRRAVAARGDWFAQGPWVWRWKDWIDRRFMKRFSDLPEMPQGRVTLAPGLSDPYADAAPAMRCGGCAAKIGADVLSRVMAKLAPLSHPDIVIGLGAPDDGAVMRAAPDKLQIHSVDFLRAFTDDPYVFGRIAANHALGDLFAMGAAPRSALAIVTLPHGPESKIEHELTQLMTGAVETLNEAGAALIGGHTAEGAELGLGFAVTGDAHEAELTPKGGAAPGDALILTKAIGTGALLAADARGEAKSRWVQAALEGMAQSSRDAGAILRAHGARAMTDVTGFGYAGHLIELLKASGVDAEISLSAMPLLSGAEEIARRGIVSSLHGQNVKAARALDAESALRSSARFPLLFDPQTAGGLLASVPHPRAEECLAALRAAGYADAAIVGRVVPRDSDAPRVRVV